MADYTKLKPGAGDPLNPKVDASRLRVPSPPSPTFPTTGADKGGKGGKEGDGDQPPLPPSNAAFLESVIREVGNGASAVVCSKPGDPTRGGWDAEAAADIDAQCPSDRNNYLNCSTFNPDAVGNIRAKREQFDAFHFVLLDDVGTKVERNRLGDFKPTWEIETSPGNSQIGIRLQDPIRDAATVKRLQDAIIAEGLCDPGSNGVGRWARLPNAINGKTKHKEEHGPFRCRLIEYDPETSYTVEEFVAALGLDLTPASSIVGQKAPRISSERGDGVFTPMPSENPVLTALRERGLYKSMISAGKHDVTCPWVAEHTDALDSGTAYFEPDDDFPIGGFSCQHSHHDKYHIAQLLEHLAVKPDQARGKARIDVVAGEMNCIRRAAEKTLARQGGYYQAGGAIVVIRTDPSTGDISTEFLSEVALAAALADGADWFRYDGRAKAWVRCDPPPRNVQTLLRSPKFDHLPVLTGLARQPYFREFDGKLVTTPGYDPTSGRFAAFAAAEFLMPEPTKEAARRALAELDQLLDEFRFASPEDRSTALCAMLTAAVRPSLPVAPAFNITASTPGSGKSYLASTIMPFAGPGPALKTSYPVTGEEATKSILSIFLAAPAGVLFDDMQTQWVAHGAINRALTSDTITDRVLGVSRTVTVGTRSFMMGTGNNVGPVRDMTRRVLTIRLHHKTATPALENYVGRPAEVVLASRGKFVVAALTIIAAWKADGSPRTDVPSIASYGVWSDMCRQPLLWLGQPDPATSIIEQLTHDPDQDDLERFLKAWHAAIGDKPVKLRELLGESRNHDDLSDAIIELPVMDRDAVNHSRFGWYLRRNANRVVGGLELQSVANSTRNAWRVVAIEVGPVVPEPTLPPLPPLPPSPPATAPSAPAAARRNFD